MAPSGLFYLWIFLSYTIGILGSLCILLRSYMCSQHSIFSQSWLIMIERIFFQNEMAFLFGFSHLHYSLVLILSMVGIYLMIIQTMPGVLTFIGGSLFFSAVTWTANSIFCHLEWKNSYTEKTEENKNIIKTVKEKIYEKSNARKIRS